MLAPSYKTALILVLCNLFSRRAISIRPGELRLAFVHALGSGLLTTLGFFWSSVFGIIFGFLVSAIVQVVLTPATMHRYLGPNLKGVLAGAGFGIISSSCSYGSAAAARGFYQKGADVRSIFSFLVASTNMNVAILIYRKSFPERVTWTFVALFVVGAMLAGGIMELAIGSAGSVSTGSMTFSDRFTLILNLIGIAAVVTVALAAARARAATRRATSTGTPSVHG